ncbi:MAG TPA: carbon-nitrogen hydrolase family protein [Bacteroidota bacterium]|jgi:predicted amidohydrolase|nr:carbon-nitrogen hydrolase family protein [Bacteroidota bacterium]
MKLILLQPKLAVFDSTGNLKAISSLIEQAAPGVSADDIILLPEHFTFDDNEEIYKNFLRSLARLAGCTIVGGSHHRNIDGKRINIGNVVDKNGNEIGNYTKLRPYFNEQQHVVPGDHVGELRINGKNFLILICADFWYSDILHRTTQLPDVLLIPSLSVSRKSDPEYSRSLWHHLAISRAYEFGVYVGISDWSEESKLPKHRTCGVGGFANPAELNSEDFFRPVVDGVSVVDLDFDALEKFREDRRMRGFFWR